MRECDRLYRPTILILLEPRISGTSTDEVCRRLGKSRWIRSEATGYSGGVWLLWDGDTIDVKLIHVHKFFVHVAITLGSGKCWMLTDVYASPNANIRRHLWSTLNKLYIEGSWLLMGDFNCVLRGEERSSGAGVSDSFVSWVAKRGLVDLGCTGHKFTWTHGVEVQNRRSAHSYSDHCPLLLQLNPGLGVRLGDRPFKFHAMWLRHKDFRRLIKEEWKWNDDLISTLKDFATKLKT